MKSGDAQPREQRTKLWVSFQELRQEWELFFNYWTTSGREHWKPQYLELWSTGTHIGLGSFQGRGGNRAEGHHSNGGRCRVWGWTSPATVSNLTTLQHVATTLVLTICACLHSQPVFDLERRARIGAELCDCRSKLLAVPTTAPEFTFKKKKSSLIILDGAYPKWQASMQKQRRRDIHSKEGKIWRWQSIISATCW